MIIILIENSRHRSKYLSEYLKEHYKGGRVHHLTSIDKVGEISRLVKATKNYGIAKEIDKLWRSYNESIADEIISYIQGYKKPSDIALINIDSEENIELFLKRLEYHNCKEVATTMFLGKVTKSYTEERAEGIIRAMNS